MAPCHPRRPLSIYPSVVPRCLTILYYPLSPRPPWCRRAAPRSGCCHTAVHTECDRISNIPPLRFHSPICSLCCAAFLFFFDFDGFELHPAWTVQHCSPTNQRQSSRQRKEREWHTNRIASHRQRHREARQRHTACTPYSPASVRIVPRRAVPFRLLL